MARVTMTEGPGTGDSGFRLNGRHVLIILLAFFGVVFAVNFTMMHSPSPPSAGLEGIPYKDGLPYNTELKPAGDRMTQGWKVEAQHCSAMPTAPPA